MIEYFQTHQHAFWFTLGFALLAIEALVFGFSSGLVLFAGFGALITGGLLWSGILPNEWLYTVSSFGICSAASAALLWKPLLRLQNFDVPAKDNSSDIIGYTFRLPEPVSVNQPGSTEYSGVKWRVEIDETASTTSMNAGERAIVTSVDAGVFRVKPAG